MNMGTASPSPQARESAEGWFARLRAPDCSDEEREAFASWRAADPAHARAFAATERMWAKFDVLKDAPEMRAYELEALAPASRSAPPGHRRRWPVPLALAATLALAAFGTWQFAPRLLAPQPEIHAATDAPRTLALQDGSSVRLDVDSRLSVRWARDARELELQQGRALFDVAHDAARPFSVAAGGGRTTALGTRFQVQRDGGQVTVTLAEGAVLVERDGGHGLPARHARLQPGEQLVYSRQPDDWHTRSIDPDAATGWSEGRLRFHATPLAEALAEINRYSPRKIRLHDPDLATLRLSGTFRAGDADAIATAFSAVLPVRVDDTGDDIILHPR